MNEHVILHRMLGQYFCGIHNNDDIHWVTKEDQAEPFDDEREANKMRNKLRLLLPQNQRKNVVVRPMSSSTD